MSGQEHPTAQRVASRYLTAYFKPGEYILFGKFKNKRGKIVRMFTDDRGIPYIEVEPVPKGRKKNRIFGLYSIRKMPPEAIAETRAMEKTASELNAYLEGFFRRHRYLERLTPPVIEKATGSSSGHPEARQHGNEIWLFPKFWRLDQKTRDFVMVHEIGHYRLSRRSLSWLIKMGEQHGIDMWNTSELPFGQHNMEEAFADAFASYHLDPGELRRRYPNWVPLVEAVG